ncbi:MAG: hypothetical protein P4L96_19085 [Rhodoferax sp.]|nr:hypothetical protein [Rhodoferax sp.]
MSGSKLSDALSPPLANDPRSELHDQPLGLTVHSMPVPQSLQGDAQRTVRGRWKMIAVMLVCAAPVIASYFTYYVIRPQGRVNFGALIDPQRPIPAVSATTLAGQSVPLRSLQGQWLLLSVANAACDTSCQQRLYLQHQMRVSLGKDMDRVDWVWLVADDAPVPANLLPALKDATVLRVPSATLLQWLTPAGGHQMSEHLYLVDPMGNFMMRFPANLDPAGAAKAKGDIERLLRASASWDKPGR